MIKQQDSLEFLKEQNEFEFDLIFGDPPYALGSEFCIKDGKIDYKKAVDFMNKWDMPSGDFWENWFNESYRTLKHGGYCILFGIDRQNVLFKYYAINSGFTICQSLYWYFISNFPKASDLSKMIDKHFGAERDKLKPKNYTSPDIRANNLMNSQGKERLQRYEEAPSTNLAQKYSGYKYSIAPLKQTCEEIMIFQKPTKTGSVLHDVLAMENGDETITCGALDIEGNRVETKDNLNGGSYGNTTRENDNFFSGKKPAGAGIFQQPSGRYPAQTFLTGTQGILDEQSGELTTGGGDKRNKKTNVSMFFKEDKRNKIHSDKSSGGCSKILHSCNYEEMDFDILNYCPKVSPSERNAGLEEKYNLFEQQEGFEGKVIARSNQAKAEEKRGKEFENYNIKRNGWNAVVMKNTHPTLKPIKLITKILKLFKTPNEQKIYFPFAGSGSEIIGGHFAGFTNWIATEINPEYVKISEARIKHWTGGLF